jgi:hypothetical protein
MSALGHERRFDHLTIRSGLPPTSDISGVGRHFSFVPGSDVRSYPQFERPDGFGGDRRRSKPTGSRCAPI